MLVTCPNCSTQYNVPDQMVGMKGRKMRCSRCQNQWQQPFVASQPEARAKRPEARMVVDPPRPPKPQPVMVTDEPPDVEEEAPIEDDLLAKAMREEERVGDDGAPAGEEEGGNPFDRIAQMMMEQPPAPIPDMFASTSAEPPAPRRRGMIGLIVLAVVVVVVVAAGLLYFLQDQVIARYPATAKVYDNVGARNEVLGAGLLFRDYNSERTSQNNTEVLVVRGVIANTTDQSRAIPPLRLALYDGQNLVQEKVVDPPQPTLEAKGTVGFRINLEQPDAHASRFEVTFAAKGGGQSSKSAEPGK